MKGCEPNERGINELVDQALAALQGDDLPVKHAAHNCLQRLAQLGSPYELLVEKALNTIR